MGAKLVRVGGLKPKSDGEVLQELLGHPSFIDWACSPKERASLRLVTGFKDASLRGCFPLDSRPLCWAASRALQGLKTGAPGKFPPIVSRGVFFIPYPIWWPQQPPPAAQRNGPFFSRGAPAGHGGRQAPAPPRPASGCAPLYALGRAFLGPTLASAGTPPVSIFFWQAQPQHAGQRIGNEARTEVAPVQ
jgi:hypothetical protein